MGHLLQGWRLKSPSNYVKKFVKICVMLCNQRSSFCDKNKTWLNMEAIKKKMWTKSTELKVSSRFSPTWLLAQRASESFLTRCVKTSARLVFCRYLFTLCALFAWMSGCKVNKPCGNIVNVVIKSSLKYKEMLDGSFIWSQGKIF